MAAENEKPYRKLTGIGYRRTAPAWMIVALFFVIGIFALLLRGRRVQLWLGSDHLLVVDSDGAREYYKRIRYQDVQTIMLRKTSEGTVGNAVLGVVALLFLVFAMTADSTTARGVLFGVAAFFALFLVLNSLLGPTCVCQLRTAVQTEELPSLNRVRRALKALDRLRPLIVAAQGQLAPEEIPARMQALLQGSEFKVQSPEPGGAAGPQP